MKKILLTGKTGFIGKNVINVLNRDYNVFAPSRKEIDLRDTNAVEKFLKLNKFDVIVHCANPNPVKNSDSDLQTNFLEDSLRIFMNFYRMNMYYNKMLYLGSGAEFDKSRAVHMSREKDILESIPFDGYGLSKYIMNELAQKTHNIFNLRIFGCYGPYDHESKFITHCIRCCLQGTDITIRQNCIFDYLHVYDIAKVLVYAIESELKYHDYNIASGVPISLVSIANEVKKQMGSNEKIVILKSGWNKEYTANISRMQEEFEVSSNFIPLSEGIALQIAHEKENYI